MPSKGWGKGTDILNAVSDCMVRRFSTKEALVRLESLGFTMSEAKFRRIKRHIRESTQDRLDFIAYKEYSQSHIDNIDSVKAVNNRLWEISNERKGSKDEIRCLELIPQNIKILEELYDANPIVAAISDKLGVKQNVS